MTTAAKTRIRGIYATALTALLDDGHEIVQASPQIRARFDDAFPDDAHGVAVDTTNDRLGVELSGDPGDVDAIHGTIGDVAIDTLSWRDPAPRGAVFDVVVEDTARGGAIVDLDGVSGYLPFTSVDDHVSEGNRYRVQVREPNAPWIDRRHVVAPDIRVSGGLCTLVRGERGIVDAPDDAARELVGLTDLLSIDPPRGWGISWEPPAANADLDALSTSLRTATERATALDDALSVLSETATERATPLDDAFDDDANGPVAEPKATTWVWFGRESRFALDDVRRDVTDTMPGHHRIKAGSRHASAAVDFAESLCPSLDGDFQFDVVTHQFGPIEGDTVAISHGKPDGRTVPLGHGTVTDRTADGELTVHREISGRGTYDALDVPRETGDVAITSFKEGRWWYPTVYRGDDVKGTYVNVCTPVEVFPDELRYVDLHVDVVKHADGTVERVDDDELDDAETNGSVPPALAEKARTVASSLERALA